MASGVSIPIGFSGSLQHKTYGHNHTDQNRVSIPIGFSGSLQHQEPIFLWGEHFIRFNPYRVFRFVATRQDGHNILSRDRVSIPIGFSGSLQPILPCPGYTRWQLVSIPIGFSGSLQLDFSLTYTDMTGEFQSLSGFQVRCNS